MQQISEATPHINVKLCDIPEVIIHNDTSYDLRGVLNYRPRKSFLRSSIGHYTTYARRRGGNWELYDDLKKNLCQYPKIQRHHANFYFTVYNFIFILILII